MNICSLRRKEFYNLNVGIAPGGRSECGTVVEHRIRLVPFSIDICTLRNEVFYDFRIGVFLGGKVE
jgi:hypothetical protein